MIEVDSRKDVGEYVLLSKYAHTVNGKKEEWSDAVARVMGMHRIYYADKVSPHNKEKFDTLLEKVTEAYSSRKILGAQRALQYGGELMIEKPSRFYNCSASYLDRVRFFEEGMYLLLCGCGIGYSVQKVHVDKLPIPMGFNFSEKSTYIIPDSIEGWSRALGLLMECYYHGGANITFDYSFIRKKGTFIRGGFKAPGHEPLKVALDKIKGILSKISGRKLTSLELHYIMCIAANAVITGGVRRSAMICMFDIFDKQMSECKTGNWIENAPELCRSNNSVAILPDAAKSEFDEIYEQTKQFGEPGFIFVDNSDYVYNPCFTGDTMVAVADGRNAVTIKELSEENKEFPVYSSKWLSGGGRYTNKWKAEIKNATAFKTGEKEVIEVILSDGTCFRCTPDHRLALPNGEYLEAHKCVGKEIEKFFTIKNKYRTICSVSNGYSRQYKMMWEYFNGNVPDGYDIDHIENGKGDFLCNLHLLKRSMHNSKSGQEKIGENNPCFKIVDKDRYSNNMSIATTLERNSRYGGLTNFDLYEIAKGVHEGGKCISHETCRSVDNRFPKKFSKNRFGGKLSNLKKLVISGEIYAEQINDMKFIKKEKKIVDKLLKVVSIEYKGVEPVYDLTVEDNHNFYIITKGDSGYENCSGLLVHNCGEVIMKPKFADEKGKEHSGWGFCNLAEINGGVVETPEDFYAACEASAIICTLQAGYTNFNVLERWSQKIAERDALIGVGITGMCENPDVLFNPEVQRRGAEIVKETNQMMAEIIGINSAARCTVIKPSGNSSQMLGTLSGITLGKSKHYIRNIQGTNDEPLMKKWESANPQCVESSFWNAEREKVISFPVTLPDDSLLIKDYSAVEFLSLVLLTKNNWIEHGTNFNHTSSISDPTMRMNVSNTCSVKADEWEEVREFMWDHRHEFSGVSLLSASGDFDYPQSPYIEVLDEKELSEKYGSGAILSSGLIVDAHDVFVDVWQACQAATGKMPSLLSLTDAEVGAFIVKHIKDGKFLANIDGVHFSDVNCVIDHLRHKIEKRRDWVRRFNSFSEHYMNGDKTVTSNCLNHVNIFHRWQQICRAKHVDYSDIVWEDSFKDAGSEIGTACAGGSCEIR